MPRKSKKIAASSATTMESVRDAMYFITPCRINAIRNLLHRLYKATISA
jgi:hypothetical protein